MKDKWYNSDFGYFLGIGCLVLLFCTGIGTCNMLSFSKINIREKPIDKNIDE